MPNLRIYISLAVTLGTCLQACAYKPLAGSSIGYKISPTLREEAAAAGESNLYVQGWLQRVSQEEKTNLYVVALSAPQAKKQPREVVQIMPVGSGGLYGMFLPNADYQFAVFADRNKNRLLENDEILGWRSRRVSLLQNGPNSYFNLDIDVNSSAKSLPDDLLQEPLSVSSLPTPQYQPEKDLLSKRYSDEEGTLGLINPNAFLQKFSQIQYLQEPDFTDPRPTIVSVHGIDGTPSVFDYLEKQLDHTGFQSLYFYYPSGARLPSSAEILQRIFFSGDVLPRMKGAVLTAHSMGGLVAKGALNRQSKNSTPIALTISFVTPYGGVEAANAGINSSPFRVPSWVDVASGSTYLSQLFQPLPQGTQFHLIAGNSAGKSDGTISVQSQLFAPALAQAQSALTLKCSHVGIMSDPRAAKIYLSLLTNLEGKETLTRRVNEIERIARAKLTFAALAQQLESASLSFRVMDVTQTLRRFAIEGSGASLVLQVAVGQAIRADIVSPTYQRMDGPWPSTNFPEEFLEFIISEIQSTLEVDLPTDAPSNTPPPLPPAPNVITSFPPPVHLFMGLSATGNLGEQYLTVQVPIEFSMYWGNWGFGTDVRLPLFAPTIQTATADLKFHPFGVGMGPRLRFGDKNALVVAQGGINMGAEFGTLRFTEPSDDDFGRKEGDLIDLKSLASWSAYGSAHVGFRISKDFYVRAGLDGGSLFSPLSINVDEEKITLLQPAFIRGVAGIEIRIP